VRQQTLAACIVARAGRGTKGRQLWQRLGKKSIEGAARYTAKKGAAQLIDTLPEQM
jgi:hypothetical protein